MPVLPADSNAIFVDSGGCPGVPGTVRQECLKLPPDLEPRGQAAVASGGAEADPPPPTTNASIVSSSVAADR